MKKHIILLATALIALTQAQAAPKQALDAQWADSLSLTLTFPVSESKDAGSDYAVTVAPTITGPAGQTLDLDPVIFRGKKNKKYVDRQRYFGDEPEAIYRELSLGDTLAYSATIAYADAPWLWSGKICLSAERTRSGCCDIATLEPSEIGCTCFVPPFIPQVVVVEDNTGKAGELQVDNPVLCHIDDYKPYDTSRILRKEKGALYVHFPTDIDTITNDFRDNETTLNRIVDITRAVMADSTSDVRLIQIVGLASVEGPLKRNTHLGAARAQALKQYIIERTDATDDIFECANGGEAWTELRDQINDSDSPYRTQLLDIIDSEPNADSRERLIRKLDGGKAFAHLKEYFLGDQRNSGYMRIYFDYVPDTAAAAINQAADLLRAEKFDSALKLLLTVAHDLRAQNALGVAYYMTGNTDDALRCFDRAAAAGNDEARNNAEQIRTIIDRKQNY